MQPDPTQAGDPLDLDFLAREAFSAVCSDICDAIGMRNHELEPGARLATGPDCVLIGFAHTAVSMPIDGILERPYGGEIDFVDSPARDDLAVIRCVRRPAAAL